jgi:hypothetical protein
LLTGLGVFFVGLVVCPADAQTSSSRRDGARSARPLAEPELLAGIWQYNAEESVNAATGRPERAARVAGVRAPARPAAGSATPARPSALAGASFAPGSPAVTALGPTVAIIQENRSLARDLLEIPEALTIAVTPAGVTFTDDLEREWTYSTDGVPQRYQMGAALFNAVTAWNGPALEKSIDAANGFRMTETYFLSPDGRRMFVLLRVTSARKDAPVMGINRVYDRIDE